jgi:hypothetical protein
MGTQPARRPALASPARSPAAYPFGEFELSSGYIRDVRAPAWFQPDGMAELVQEKVAAIQPPAQPRDTTRG